MRWYKTSDILPGYDAGNVLARIKIWKDDECHILYIVAWYNTDEGLWIDSGTDEKFSIEMEKSVSHWCFIENP